MTTLTHRFSSPVPDDFDPDIVSPNDWNDDHQSDHAFVVLGVVPANLTGARSLAVSGGLLSLTDGGAGNAVTIGLTNSAIDHGGLTGLADDDHTQYALLAGRVGGQTLFGGTAGSNVLNLVGSSDAARGAVYLGANVASDPIVVIDETVPSVAIDSKAVIGSALFSSSATLEVNGSQVTVTWARFGSVTTPANTSNGDVTAVNYFGTIADMATGYRIGGAAASGNYLRGNGTNFVSNTIQAGDLPGSFSGFANPTGTVGLTAVNGVLTTAMRSDAAPPLSQAIAPTWTAIHKWSITGAVPALQIASSGSAWVAVNSTSGVAPTAGYLFQGTTDPATAKFAIYYLDAGAGDQLFFGHTNSAFAQFNSNVGFLHSGYLRIGSLTTPSNTTAGDVTGIRFFATTFDASTGYRIGGAAASGNYLRGDGTNFVSNTIQAGDLPGSFSGFANPTASVGLTAVNGSATTAMRSDAAPPLSQAIAPTWTGKHTWGAQAAGGTGISNPTLMINSLTGLAGARTIILHGENNSERILIGSTAAPQFEGVGYGGTWAAPTRTTINQYLAGLASFGYDNAGTPAIRGATGRFALFAGSDWTTTSLETYASISGTGSASTTITEMMRIQVTGTLVLGFMNVGAVSPPTNVTAGDMTVTRLFLNNDSNFSLQFSGSNPLIILDSGDYLSWNRSANLFGFTVGSANKAVWDGNGSSVWLGYMRVGSLTAPANTTAGDMTSVRFCIGDVAFTTGETLTNLSGFFHTSYNSASRPVSDTTYGGLAISWNYSAGGAEVDLWNVYDNANGFSFKQKTGASAHTDMVSMLLAGTLVAGYLNVGSLSAPSHTSAGDLSCTNIYCSNLGTFTHATGNYMIEYNGTGTGAALYGHYIDTNGFFHLDWVANAQICLWTTGADYQIFGSVGTKASGTLWANPSDARIKNVVGTFDDGLPTVLQLQPKRWVYNDKAWPSVRNTPGLGFVAQDLLGVADYMVTKGKGNLGDEEVDDFLTYDGHALSFILVNAIKELSAEVDDLKAQLAARNN